MSAKNLIEFEKDAYKVKLKLCQVQIFVKDTKVEPLIQISDNSVFDSETLIIRESKENKTFKQPHFYTVITSKLLKDHPEIQMMFPATVQCLFKAIRRTRKALKLLRKQ